MGLTLRAVDGRVVVRKAGEVTKQPGFWQSLGDNDYTRGWSEMTARVLGPADRMVASDADLKAALAKSFGAAPGPRRIDLQSPTAAEDVMAAAMDRMMPDVNGVNSARRYQMDMLDAIDPSKGLSGRYAENGMAAVAEMKAQAAAQGTTLSDREALELVIRDSLLKDVKRDQLMAGMEKFGPSLPISNAGQWAHAALGNAAAAYGLPLAGAGLATWGVHDVLAAQQQAEKESQLPLS